MKNNDLYIFTIVQKINIMYRNAVFMYILFILLFCRKIEKYFNQLPMDVFLEHQ